MPQASPSPWDGGVTHLAGEAHLFHPLAPTALGVYLGAGGESKTTGASPAVLLVLVLVPFAGISQPRGGFLWLSLLHASWPWESGVVVLHPHTLPPSSQLQRDGQLSEAKSRSLSANGGGVEWGSQIPESGCGSRCQPDTGP